MRDRLAVRRPLLVAMMLVAITGAVVGCGSGNSPEVSTSSTPPAAESSTATSVADSTEYPAGKEEICGARDQLKESIAAVTSPGVLAGGATAVKAALEKIQADLDALRAAAATDYKSEVDAVESALDQVKDAVDNLGDGGGTANIGTVTTAAGALATAADDLFSKLNTACGS